MSNIHPISIHRHHSGSIYIILLLKGAFLYPRPGQKPAQAKGRARLGPAFFGLAWPGFWPQAGAGTSLIPNGYWPTFPGRFTIHKVS
jgi:hypothetical protein